MFGLYLHFPFCLSKCLYCDFNSYAGKKELYSPYLEALKIEIKQAASLHNIPIVDSLYFGGGTPTVYEAEELAEIFLLCQRLYSLSKEVEVSIEANPETLDLAKLKALKDVGFNRLSIGIQSLDEKVLKALGRAHNKEKAIESYRWARQLGFQNINLDLIFGLEGQSISSWRETLRKALELMPEHISAYPLELREPNFSLKEGEEDLQAEMYELTHSFLTNAGFEHYEISNYARPGFRCKHNLIYWQNENYLGFGAGAHSHLGKFRFCNQAEPSIYIEKLFEKSSPIREMQKLTSKELLTETVFLGLRLSEGLNLESFRERFGLDLVETFSTSIKSLLEEGLILLTPKHLRLSRKGRLLANQVFLEFL